MPRRRAADELDADRQAVVAPGERQETAGWPVMLHLRERRELPGVRAPARGASSEASRSGRRRGKRRRQQQVVAVPEGDDAPGELAQARGRAHVLDRAGPGRSLDQRCGQRLELLGRLSVGPGITCQAVMKKANSRSSPRAASPPRPRGRAPAAARPLLDGRDAVRVDRRVDRRRRGGQPIRSAPGSALDLVGERPLGRRRPVRVAGP